MISKADALKAKKAMQAPTLEEVAKRLWDCHDKHLGRVDQLRQLLENERESKFKSECTFNPC